MDDNISKMVSIIVPVYNGKDVIDDCIRSIVASTKSTDYEILIVDDDSKDGSADIIKKYISDRVTLLTNKINLGFTKTVMRGIDSSKGEIIALLNMDTIVDRDWLKELIRPLESGNRVGITGSKIFYMDSDNIQHAGGFLDRYGLSYHIGRGELDIGQYNREKEVEYVCGASLACKRDVLRDVGGLDTGYGPLYYEEVDLANRFRRAGYKIMYIPSSRLRHCEQYTITNGNVNIFYFVSRSRLRYILKTYSLQRFLFQFIWYEIIYFIKNSNRNKWYLLKAYVHTLSKLPEILFIRLKDKALIDKLKKNEDINPTS